MGGVRAVRLWWRQVVERGLLDPDVLEIADLLGVSKATVSQHLRVAEGNVFETLFED